MERIEVVGTSVRCLSAVAVAVDTAVSTELRGALLKVNLTVRYSSFNVLATEKLDS